MVCVFVVFKRKTTYEMRIIDWSSDVCSSDLIVPAIQRPLGDGYLSQELRFAGFLFGVRPFEKVKGVRCCGRTRNLLRFTLPCGRPPYHRTTLGNSSRVLPRRASQIGRASCRERVCQYV